MDNLSENFLNLKKSFTISISDMIDISKNFSQDISNALKGKESQLKMLPTFIKNPTGWEKGEFLAVDFGGTNVRVLKVMLDGKRGFKVLAKTAFPLKDSLKSYDYTASTATASNLFDFIASHIKKIAKNASTETIFLGHTFSFPCRQKSVNEAFLIKWTKELETAQAEGCDIGKMLTDAITRAEIKNVRPIAILNDTTATLLTAAYQKQGADIASICGTGHNTCYLEPQHPLTCEPMIVNMESGNFDKFPRTIYDQELDQNSEKPFSQNLEKSCGGHYLGEILRLVSQNYFNVNAAPYSIKGEDVASLLASVDGELHNNLKYLTVKFGIRQENLEEINLLREIALLIVERSARLVAATFAGTLMHLDPSLKNEHIIAIDGSLYEKMPGYAFFIRKALDEFFSEKSGKIHLELVKDGSGVGAAIAAASVCQY